jgi:GNAT superfamily N-acetyltransferase
MERAMSTRNKEAEEKNSPIFLIQVLREQSELVVALFIAYCAFYGKTVSPQQAQSYIEDGLAQRDSVIFVAVQQLDKGGDPRPVGFVQLHPSRSSGQLARRWIINDLYVLPEVRRAGIGRQLVERAQAFAFSTNAKDMILRTAENNREARALYESLGWVVEEDVVTYRLRL